MARVYGKNVNNEIADGAVTSSKIGPNEIGGGHVASAEIGTTELADGAVTLAKNKVATGSVEQVAAASTGISHNLGETPGAVVLTEQDSGTTASVPEVLEKDRNASTVTVVAVTSGVDIKYAFQA